MALWTRRSEDPALVPAAPGVAADMARNEREVREAYRRGRQDEKARRKRHPIAMSVGFALAAVGAVVLAVAAYNGSFSRGGQVVDQNLAQAADQAEPVVRGAASNAQQAASSAGEELRERVSRTTPAAPADARPQPAPAQQQR